MSRLVPEHGRRRRADEEGAPTMILPKVRDPRFVTIRRGGTLTDSDHRLLALWAASCAEHVLDLFESAQPADPRPRQAIEHARAWVRGEVTVMQARAAGGHAMGAARDLRGAARTPRMPRVKPGRWPTSPRMSSGRPPTRSRRYVLPRRQATAGLRGDSSASGSVTSCRRRYASSFLMTRGCGMTSAGRCLTAEGRLRGAAPLGRRLRGDPLGLVTQTRRSGRRASLTAMQPRRR